MSDLPLPDTLSDCGCCEPAAPTPSIVNRPGLPALSYRIGTWATFLDAMIARLPSHALETGDNRGTRPLAALTTRAATDDATLATLDACAVMADVLAFYLERYANEGFLMTATERRSVLELANTIGYQLSPGVAASTYLAFTVEAPAVTPEALPPEQRAFQNSPGSTAPTTAIVPLGTKVMSVPGPDEKPQAFESAAALEARLEWNALRPRLAVPQIADPAAKTVWVEGIVTGLEPGGRVLVLAEDEDGDVVPTPKAVVSVTPEDALDRTRIDLADSTVSPVYVPPSKPLFQFALPTLAPFSLNTGNVGDLVVDQTWKEKDLTAQIGIQSWSGKALAKHLNHVQKAKQQPPPPSFEVTDPVPGIIAFTVRTSPFGHNAPRYATLPLEQRTESGPYSSRNWDTSPPSIEMDSQGNDYGTVSFFLERGVKEVLPGGWALVEGSDQPATPVRIAGVTEQSLADYALSGRATGVITHDSPELSGFKVRTTAIHAGSRALALAALPIESTIGKGTAEEAQLTLDRLALGFTPDQPIAVTGERADLTGVIASEVVLLANVVHTGGFTTLFFQSGLAFEYVRASVTLNANVVLAMHGETVSEMLGSGDAATPNQRFTLKKPPLTYVPADTPSGSASTLEVRVADVLWSERSTLHDADPADESFIIRIDDDANATLTFGDGTQGTRLPTGAANIIATYRSGIGLAGEVGERTLTVLQSRPLGIRDVTNPVSATGAGDPEMLAAARDAAPLTVRTLDRVVSLDDYADFARAFAGVGKASATELWDGRGRIVVVTIASAGGDPLDENGETATKLADAIEAARAPLEPFRVVTFQPLFFDLSAKVLIDQRYTVEKVLAGVEAMLLERFSFAGRAFAQPVTAAEIVAAMHEVTGVVAVDLDALHLSTDAENNATLASVLESLPARFEDGVPVRAQLLLISPAGIALEEMTS